MTSAAERGFTLIELIFFIVVVSAGLAGILVPLTLDRYNLDPALGSSALVTTVTDVVGFLAFLGFAIALLL